MLRKLEDITPDMYEELNREIEQTFEEGCHGNCASCQKGCSAPLYPHYAKGLFAVTGGKGGTGKSTVTALLAAALAQKGFRVGILDADIAGGTQPALWGATGRPQLSGTQEKSKIIPLPVRKNVGLISYDLIALQPEKPVLLPAAQQSEAVSGFYTDVAWEGYDIIFVDMPSGAGDIPLNLYSSLPVKGTIIVAESGTLSVSATRRCIGLCSMLMSPPVAFIENKALEESCTADAFYDLPEGCRKAWLPLSPELMLCGHNGTIDEAACPSLSPVIDYLEAFLRK